MVTSSGNTIGGTASGSGDVISGNSEVGVDFTAVASGNSVVGDFIGTAYDGVTPVPNGTGVYIEGSATANTIGGTISAARDVISGNTDFGLNIISVVPSPSMSDNLVEGDYIGLARDGTTFTPNGVGVQIDGGSKGNTIGGTAAGARDVISGNNTFGVKMNGPGTSSNVVEGSYLGTAAGGSTTALTAMGSPSSAGRPATRSAGRCPGPSTWSRATHSSGSPSTRPRKTWSKGITSASRRTG